MLKIFTIANIRELDFKVSDSEISFSRMVEILNQMAYSGYKDVTEERNALRDELTRLKAEQQQAQIKCSVCRANPCSSACPSNILM